MAILEPTAKADTANMMRRISGDLRATEAEDVQRGGIEHLAEQAATGRYRQLQTATGNGLVGTLEQMRKIRDKVK